jgi:hypothetical protein
MEMWEPYDLLVMCTATTNNSTPHDNNTASWPDAKQVYVLMFSDLNRGDSAGLLPNLNLAGLQNHG